MRVKFLPSSKQSQLLRRLVDLAPLSAIALLVAALAIPQTSTNDESDAPVDLQIVAPQTGATTGKCASGCTLKKHPVAPFTVPQFRKALESIKHVTPDELRGGNNDALDTLLFYGRRTRALLSAFKQDGGQLSHEHASFLDRELARRAHVALRVIDETGRVRAHIARDVPFGQKQHLQPKTVNVQPMSFNGTVMRTGLGHIWARY